MKTRGGKKAQQQAEDRNFGIENETLGPGRLVSVVGRAVKALCLETTGGNGQRAFRPVAESPVIVHSFQPH